MKTRARDMIAAFGIRTPSKDVPISVLSGGNVQRAVQRANSTAPSMCSLSPTLASGSTWKAVAEIRARIVAVRNSGAAVLLISEDLDEIREMADRILVMCGGAIVFEAPAGTDARVIGSHMVGHG